MSITQPKKTFREKYGTWIAIATALVLFVLVIWLTTGNGIGGVLIGVTIFIPVLAIIFAVIFINKISGKKKNNVQD